MISKYKFSDLYEMSSGISTDASQAGHGTPFASFSVVFNNYFLPESLDDLMNASAQEQKTYSIKTGDIFLTRTSEVIDELGMSCVALRDYPKATFSGFLKRLRPKQNDISYEKYMGFYLRSSLFRKTITNNAVMTLRASLNEDIFSYLNIYLPDYKTQQKAGDFLFLLHNKITLNKRINAELEQMVNTLFNYWFIQFDFPDKDGKPYKSNGGKMVWHEKLKREIPDAWTNGDLSDIGDIIGGSTPSKNNMNNFTHNGIGWITPKDLAENIGNKFITKGELDVSDTGLKAASLKILPEGTVLLSSRAPIGYMAIANKQVTTNQGFKSFIPKQGFTTPFVYYTIKSYLPAIINNANGSTFKEISGSTLKTVVICLPQSKIVDKFTSIANLIFKKQNLIEIENQKLAELRDWLLPMFMNGQISFIKSKDIFQNRETSLHEN